jgi:hypothetical protein
MGSLVGAALALQTCCSTAALLLLLLPLPLLLSQLAHSPHDQSHQQQQAAACWHSRYGCAIAAKLQRKQHK